jgi:haloalkane dehalogenase
MPSPPSWLDRSSYPFAGHWLSLKDGTLHYVDEGSGPPVVLVHGTPTWSFEYRHVIRTLAQSHRCLAPDHLGFGLSERPANASYTPESHAARFREFVDQLGLSTFDLVVHDYGGPIAAPLALEGRVARLVLLNTWLWPFDDDAEMMRRGRLMAGAFGRFMYKWMNASLQVLTPSVYADRRRLTRAIHRQYLEPFRDREARVRVLWPLARAILGSRAFYADLHRGAERLREIPTLIVWGMKDTAFRPHQLDRWMTLLPGAEVVRLEDAGHWPHEEAPSEVTEHIERFLRAA